MQNKGLLKIFVLILILSISLLVFGSAFSEKVEAADLMALEANIFNATGNAITGDIVVEIYDAASSGNLIYNSTDDFLGNITGGKVDIMLGSGTVPLNLTYGYNYFMEIYVDGNEINFSGQDRQEFTSNLGNMTLSRISIDSDISPATNNTIDIGTNSTYFRNLFVSTLNILTKITTSQIANNAITSALIAQRTITSDDIADNAINTTHIEDSTITTDDISIDTIIAADIAAGAIGTSEILDETILPEDISSVGWTNLTDYPSACPAGQAITQIGDTITCAAVSSLDGNDLLWSNDTNNINTTHLEDGTILATDLSSTLDVANYSAGSGISITDHVISSTNSMDYTNLALTNQTNDFTEDVTIGGGVAAGGITLETDGDAYINGTLYVMENITNVDIDQLNVNGSIIPSFNNLFDLGSSSFRYNNLFVTTLDIATRIVNSQIGPDSINSTQIIDGSIAAEDLESTLDVANYTAGSGISITDHVISSTNSMDYTNLALTNQSTEFTSDLNVSGDLYLLGGGLIGCTGKLITDATGNVTCGTDATGGAGGSGDLANYATTNESTIFSDNVTIEGDLAINRGLNLSLYTSCTALETDASGNLVCGTDEGGAGASPTPWQQGADTMYNDSTGIKVGIGTKTPAVALEVVGAINATNITFADGSTQTSATSDNDSRLYGQDDDDNWIGLNVDPDGRLSVVMNSTGVASALENNIITSSKFKDTGDFDLISNWTFQGNLTVTNGSDIVFYVDPVNKFVGINTSSPTNALTIEGDLNVTGHTYFADLNISGVQFTEGNVTADYFFGDGSQLTGIDNNSLLKGKNSSGDWTGLEVTSNGRLKLEVGAASVATTVNDNAITSDKLTTSDIIKTGNFNVTQNLTSEDSLITDYIYPNALSTINLKNITILEDIRVLGNSYLGSFTIEDDLVIGNNNFSSTRVGIGIMEPSGILHLNGSSGNILYMDTATGNNNAIFFRNGESPTEKFLMGVAIGTDNGIPGTVQNDFYMRSTQNLLFSADGGGTSDMIIETGGNVGIGTISPTALLHVFNGDVNFSNGTTNQFFFDSSSGNIGIGKDNPGAKFEIAGNDAYEAKYRITHGTANPTYYWDIGYSDASLGNDLQFVNNDGGSENTRMVIEYSGNVGIGTTSPTTLLDVYGTLNVSGTAGYEGLIVDSAGDVGIGMSAPIAALHISSVDADEPAAKSSLSIRNYGFATAGITVADDSDMYIGTDGAGKDIKFTPGASSSGDEWNDTSAVKMTIQAGGNVGIGTTSPSAPLEVAGNIYGISQTNPLVLLGNADSGGTYGVLTYANATGDIHLYAAGGASGTTGDVILGVNAAGAVASTGNVGIGTTSPSGVADFTVLNVKGPTSYGGHIIAESNDAEGFVSLYSGVGSGDNPSIIFNQDLRFGNSSKDAAGYSEYMRIEGNTGNVGIGTTSPGTKLDVAGIIRANSAVGNAQDSKLDLVTTYYGGATNYADGGFQFVGSIDGGTDAAQGGLKFYGGANSDTTTGWAFKSNGVLGSTGLDSTAQMVIMKSGNVGIGTTSPGILVDIKTADNTDGLRWRNTGGYTMGVLSRSPSYNSGAIDLYLNNVTGIHLDAGAQNSYFAPNTGNVGIGTTDPTHLLNINSGATPTLSQTLVEANDAGAYSVLAYGADNINVGFDTYFYGGAWNSTDAGSNFAFRKNGDLFKISYDSGIAVGSAVTLNDAMVFDTSGNVGIGTTSPTALLEVSGINKVISTLYLNSTMLISTTDANGADVGGTLSLGGKNSVNAQYGHASLKGAPENTGGNDDGYLAFYTLVSGTGTTEKMRINAAGNVGIGTTSPTHSLNVVSTSSTALNLSTSHADSWVVLSMSGSGTGGGIIDATGVVNKLLFRTGGTDAMLIDDTGNVGIGTTSPTSKLDIKAVSTTDAEKLISLTDSGGTERWIFSYKDSDGGLNISSDNSATRPFSINNDMVYVASSGNVGIGTTSPEAPLDIGGFYNHANVKATATVTGTKGSFVGIPTYQLIVRDDTPYAAGVGGAIAFDGDYNSGGDGTVFAAIDGVKANSGDGDYDGELRFWTRIHGGNLIQNMVLDENGNVGIGTTAPSVKLEMKNPTNTRGDMLKIGNANEGIIGHIGFNGTSPYRMYLGYGGDGSEDMVIDQNGNVGIGTTAPTHKLNVIGDINATGTIYRDGGTAVTDFVFDNYYDGTIDLNKYPYAEDYEFIPLEDLNNYLQTNRHLPNLPGKALTGSVDSAEIDRLLLEKTEEQALYIIELKQQIEEIREELKNQQRYSAKIQKEKNNEMEELKARIMALERSETINNEFYQKNNPGPENVT